MQLRYLCPVLDQFDAVKIGLTATPALHTTQIFGEPVYTYPYREAVIDGWLIDHEPPFQIITRLSDEGIVWNSGDLMEFFDPNTGQLDLVHAPDEVRIEVEQFNTRLGKLPAEKKRLGAGALSWNC